MGGLFYSASTGSGKEVTLPKSFNDTNYVVIATILSTGSIYDVNVEHGSGLKTTTSFQVRMTANNIYWYAFGY